MVVRAGRGAILPVTSFWAAKGAANLASFFNHVLLSRAKLEMREDHGLRHTALDRFVAGRLQASWGWRLVPRSLLGERLRWIFP